MPPLAPTDYELGATLIGIDQLVDLDIPNPESQFTDYSSTVVQANGVTRGLGYPSCQWHYGYLTQDQYDDLVAIIDSIGKAVFISTINNNGDFATYSANATLPDTYTMRGPTSQFRYLDITINFTHLVQQ